MSKEHKTPLPPTLSHIANAIAIDKGKLYQAFRSNGSLTYNEWGILIDGLIDAQNSYNNLIEWARSEREFMGK